MKTSILNSFSCLPLLAASLLMTARAEPPVKIYIMADGTEREYVRTFDRR